jgi:hypothetical protein
MISKRWAGFRVLVVNDSPQVIASFKGIVSGLESQAEITYATNLAGGLTALEECRNPFHLLLTDLHLPERVGQRGERSYGEFLIQFCADKFTSQQTSIVVAGEECNLVPKLSNRLWGISANPHKILGHMNEAYLYHVLGKTDYFHARFNPGARSRQPYTVIRHPALHRLIGGRVDGD